MVDPKKYTNLTLQELRDMQTSYQRRHRGVIELKPFSDKVKEYFANLSKSEEVQGIDERIEAEGKKRLHPRRVKPICDYQTGRHLVWKCYKLLADQNGVELQFSPELKNITKILTCYFTGNPQMNIDLNKGIFLYGPCGTGKTFLIKVMQLFLKSAGSPRMFKINSVPKIYNDILESDEVSLSMYYKDHRCFDDLGFEGKHLKHYGNEVKPMQIILTHRYNSFVSYGQLTHATSNLPPTAPDGESLSDWYDERIISRMREMFNLILLNGDDLRKTDP